LRHHGHPVLEHSLFDGWTQCSDTNLRKSSIDIWIIFLPPAVFSVFFKKNRLMLKKSSAQTDVTATTMPGRFEM
jgi:hypothetical protein